MPRTFGVATCLIVIATAHAACATAEESQSAAASEQIAGTAEAAGDAERGKVLFHSDTGCNVCHGENAMGSVGPNIRETTIDNVYHALQNFPDMMNWQFNFPELFEEQALLDIVAYLQTLERETAK